MCKGEAQEAIDILDSFKLTNELFREHLLDLCMNKKAKVAFDNLTTQQKTSFTKAYNNEHKDPTVGKHQKGKKAAAAGAVDDAVSESDEEKDKEALGNLDEDEIAEIKRAKQRERDILKDKASNKVNSFEMFKPKMKGEDKPKPTKAAAKKGKAKTQQAKGKAAANKGGKKQMSADDSEGSIDDDSDAKPAPKKKARTAKGKK